MKKARALVWIIWIVITILIAGGLFYYYQYVKIPEFNNQISELNKQVNQLQGQIDITEETADWQTYTNDGYKFSIKYPGKWTVQETDDGTEFTSAEMYTNIKNEVPDAIPEITLFIRNNSTELALEEFADKDLKSYGLPILSKNSIIIADKTIIKAEAGGMDTTTNYYWAHNKMIIHLNVWMKEEIAEKMITTFKTSG